MLYSTHPDDPRGVKKSPSKIVATSTIDALITSVLRLTYNFTLVKNQCELLWCQVLTNNSLFLSGRTLPAETLFKVNICRGTPKSL